MYKPKLVQPDRSRETSGFFSRGTSGTACSLDARLEGGERRRDRERGARGAERSRNDDWRLADE